MILDTLANSTIYESIHPAFKRAFEYLKNQNLSLLPTGRIELDSTNLIVNIVDISGKNIEEVCMETHNQYIDIQVPIGKSETMGWKPIEKLLTVSKPYDKEKDITFYADKASVLLEVQPYEFAIFFPSDGHQPGIGDGTYRKVIIKVKI